MAFIAYVLIWLFINGWQYVLATDSSVKTTGEAKMIAISGPFVGFFKVIWRVLMWFWNTFSNKQKAIIIGTSTFLLFSWWIMYDYLKVNSGSYSAAVYWKSFLFFIDNIKG